LALYKAAGGTQGFTLLRLYVRGRREHRIYLVAQTEIQHYVTADFEVILHERCKSLLRGVALPSVRNEGPGSSHEKIANRGAGHLAVREKNRHVIRGAGESIIPVAKLTAKLDSMSSVNPTQAVGELEIIAWIYVEVAGPLGPPSGHVEPRNVLERLRWEFRRKLVQCRPATLGTDGQLRAHVSETKLVKKGGA
jgi:hypothetical protein